MMKIIKGRKTKIRRKRKRKKKKNGGGEKGQQQWLIPKR